MMPFPFQAGQMGLGDVDIDPYFNAVSLLMKFDGTNGSTTFIDSSRYARTLTSNGGAALSTSVFKFGTASGLFASGKYVTAADDDAFNVAGGDFTIEMWIYPTSLPSGGSWAGLCCQRQNFNTQNAYTFYLSGSDSARLHFDWSTSGGSAGASGVAGPPTTPATNTWSHVAVVRSGTAITIYLNGVGGTAATIGSSVIFDSTQSFAVGILGTSDGNHLIGNIDLLRFTKGVARYTADFTPPATEFPAL